MFPPVVKTRFQIQTGQGEYRSVLDCFRKIVQQEGVSTLYRGIIAPILVEAPKRAVKFAANEQYSKWCLQLSGEQKMTQTMSIATGISTGLTEAFVVVSFELVKIRMQDKANAHRYKNSLDCAVKVLREEGPLAFFKGLESTLWRHGAWNGGYFGVIHYVKSVLPRADNSQAVLLNNFIAGTVGGTVGTMLNTPFDVVKTRIQGGVARYKWAFPGLAVILREEG
ncbi:MC/SLC25 family protein [archaeon]|nr:MAG: MC/SLC25 family protein [archaeon]